MKKDRAALDCAFEAMLSVYHHFDKLKMGGAIQHLPPLFRGIMTTNYFPYLMQVGSEHRWPCPQHARQPVL
eukprot:365847-Chlamydomonas_euryale.AAC.3